MVSEKFRHQLHQEVESWQEEGLIDQELYLRLCQRYGFSQLEVTSRNRFVAIFLVLGSLLLGLGVITLVAANWQVWPRTVKALLLLVLFVGVNWAGFRLWQGSQESWQSRLGKGLLLLGGLLLGANLALMSQMFHRSEPVYQLFFVWGLAVLVMAFALRLTVLGMLALVLLALAYGGGITTQVVLIQPSGWELAIAHFPLLASLLLLPLAYCCASRWIFALGAILTIVSLEINLPVFLENLYRNGTTTGMIVAIAAILPTAWLWAYWDWGNIVLFRPLARFIAVFCLSLLLLALSFNFWGDSPNWNDASFSFIRWQDSFVLLDLGVLTGWASWGWWRLGNSQNTSSWRLDINSSAIGIMLLLAGMAIAWQLAVGTIGATGTVLFNLLLFLLAGGMLREALAQGKRLGFWGGVLLLGVQLTARMLEYESGLLLKAIVLFGCGVAVIVAGLWFERHLRQEVVD